MYNPLVGYVTSHYNKRRKHPVTGKVTPHEGIDLASGTGKGVVSAAYKGRVERTGWNVIPYRSGQGVVIRNSDGEAQLYNHLSRIDVKVGDWVSEGQALGLEGATGNVTGPHLHFEIHYPASNDRNGWNRTRDPRLDFEAHGLTPGEATPKTTTAGSAATGSSAAGSTNSGGSTVSSATATQLRSHHERQGVYHKELIAKLDQVLDKLEAVEERVGRTATAAQVTATYQRVRPSDLTDIAEAGATAALKKEG